MRQFPGRVKSYETIFCETASSGAAVRQLTSAPQIHSNIYCEMPFSDATGRYVIFQRSPTPWGPWEAWRTDLQTGEAVLLAEEVLWTVGCAMSCDQRYFYCARYEPTASMLEIIRTEITTLKQMSVLFPHVPGSLHSMGAISLDYRYYFVAARLGPPAAHRFGVLKMDLQEGEYEVILEGGDDLCNMHVQIEPGRGEDLLIQHNRGAELDEEGRIIHLVREPYCTLFLIDTEGGQRRQLPVGKPYTRPCQGHQAWIGRTGEIILTISFEPEAQFPEPGCLLRVRPGEAQAHVISEAADFCHPNASRDGRFFVCDEWRNKTIIVGSLTTGRSKVLCETGASFRGNQWTHPHPYFTPDNQHVIFNSDRTGLPQVYAAHVPASLLEELETPA